MIRDRNFLLYHPFFARSVAESPLVLVDIGARGHLDPPWTGMDPAAIQVVGFEPDPEACKALMKQARPGSLYHPVALSNRKGRFPFYINENPYTSSIFPPNTALITRYEEKHWKTRRPVQEAELEFDTLDNVQLREPDFIKIDTQGAEYPILEGARRCLRTCFGVLVETWLQPVYAGLTTTDKVISFMRDLGFELYDINIAAAWRKRSSLALTRSKPQVIGLDLLFFNDAPERDMAATASAIKAAAIAEIFGFRDQACLHADRLVRTDAGAARQIIDILRRNEDYERSVAFRVRRLMRMLTGRESRRYPSLHY
jgi:FkbM family methyltransferase